MGERRFSDKEMNAIIQRATELQIQGTADKGGATLGQIQQAASELGISADLIEKAAAEVGPQTGNGRFSFLGGPAKADVSLVASGVLGQEDWPAFLQEVRKITGRVGTVKPVGNAFEWISQIPTGMHLSVTPKRGTSEIDIRSDLQSTVALTIALPSSLALAFGACMIAAGAGIAGLAAWIAVQALTYGLGRFSFVRLSRRRVEEMRALAEAIANYIEDEPRAAAEVEQTEPLPLRLTSR